MAIFILPVAKNELPLAKFELLVAIFILELYLYILTITILNAENVSRNNLLKQKNDILFLIMYHSVRGYRIGWYIVRTSWYIARTSWYLTILKILYLITILKRFAKMLAGIIFIILTIGIVAPIIIAIVAYIVAIIDNATKK